MGPLEDKATQDVKTASTQKKAPWYKRAFNRMFGRKPPVEANRTNIYERIDKKIWPVLYRATHDLHGESITDEDSTMRVLHLLFKNITGIEKLNIYFFDDKDNSLDPFLTYGMVDGCITYEPLTEVPRILNTLVSGENSRGIYWNDAINSFYQFNLVPQDVMVERSPLSNFAEMHNSGIIVPLILKRRLYGFIEMYGHGVRFDGDKCKEPYSLMLYATDVARALCTHLTMQTDQLTKLGMKWLFEYDLQKMVSRNISKKQDLCLVYVDGDDFKRVNDTHGHSAGDSVLKHIGKRIISSTRSNERNVYRIGGEEFAIILETSMENAIKVAKRIAHNTSASPIHVRDMNGATQLITMTVSIGIADLHTLGADVSKEKMFDVCEKLKENADAAMYAAKQFGKNCIVTLTNRETTPVDCEMRDAEGHNLVYIKIK